MAFEFRVGSTDVLVGLRESVVGHVGGCMRMYEEEGGCVRGIDCGGP